MLNVLVFNIIPFTVHILYSDNGGGIDITAKLSLYPISLNPISLYPISTV